MSTSSLILDPEAARLTSRLSTTRREIHQHPGMGFEEVRTAALVEQE